MNLKNIMLSGKPDEWFLLRMNDWEGAVGLLWSKTNKRHLGTSKGHSAVCLSKETELIWTLCELYFILKN